MKNIFKYKKSPGQYTKPWGFFFTYITLSCIVFYHAKEELSKYFSESSMFIGKIHHLQNHPLPYTSSPASLHGRLCLALVHHNGYEQFDSTLMVKTVTYGTWRWFDLATLWDTGK